MLNALANEHTGTADGRDEPLAQASSWEPDVAVKAGGRVRLSSPPRGSRAGARPPRH
jgi:hypothetical protein